MRNPMAIAGLGQGAAIAIGVGSWLVLAYVAAGTAGWQFVLRPIEEDDLARRFGPAYLEYRRAVRCWWPHRRPFTPAPRTS